MSKTIEDVLKKHGFHYEQKSYTVDSFALYDSAKAMAIEWAQLSTPCEELKKENEALKQRIAEIVYLSEQPGGYHP